MVTDSAIRLNKFISDSGYCSRREADRLIESNRVKVNGRVPALGTRVESGDEVSIDGLVVYQSAVNKSDRIYIAYHKPVGITCTTEQNVKGNIVDAIDHDRRVFPIGRLDKPSEGLILLTSDGDIVNKILRAENAHDKEYLVSVNKPIAPDFASKMAAGIPILGTVTEPCKVTVQGRTSFRIILTQGLNRQIRRMCEYLGYEVVTLKRIRIMNIELGQLRPGQWRNFSKAELASLNEAVEQSSSETGTHAAKPRRGGKSKPYKGQANKSKSAGAKTRAGKPGQRADRSKQERGSAGQKQATPKPSRKSRGKSADKRGGKASRSGRTPKRR